MVLQLLCKKSPKREFFSRKILLIMKFTVFIFFAACMAAGATGHAQKITLSVKNYSLDKVLTEIEKQAGINFIYSKWLIERAEKVTLEVKDKDLQDILNLIFKNQPVDYKISDKYVVLSPKLVINNSAEVVQLNSTPPPVDIIGQVINEKGEGIAATITVKGTKTSIATDSKGNFTLKVIDENATLIVTGVAIQTSEIKLNGKTNLVIKIKTKIDTGETVVVTGFGIVRREKELGYSTTTISGAEINRANSGNLLTGLTARVSGLNIATQSNDINPQMQVLLRGIRSFGTGSNNQPLFIFNGSPLSFGADQTAAKLVMDFINNINPADVDKVTILKGANAAAVYGPEAVNGVIVITTKKGEKGKPVINFQNNLSFGKIDYRYDKSVQKVYGLGDGNVDADGNGIYDPTSNYNWGPKYNGEGVSIGYPDENGNRQMVPYSYKNDARKFWNVSTNNRTNLSISQADNTGSYLLGLGYAMATGTLPGDKQKRAFILLNTTKQINWLQTGLTLNYTNTSSNLGPQIELQGYPTFIPLTSYKDYKNSYWANHNRFWRGISPYEIIDGNRSKRTQNALIGNLMFSVKPFRWLTIRDQIGVNFYGSTIKATTSPIYFAPFAAASGDFLKATNIQPSVADITEHNLSINNDLLFFTTHKMGDFSLRTNSGVTVRDNNYNANQLSGILTVPVYNIQLAVNRFIAAEEVNILTRSIAAYASTNIGYKEKIFIELTARNEWDSKRAKIARGKDFYFGGNTSIVISDIFPALSNSSWLNTFRIRSSYTKTANMNILPFQANRTLELVPGYPYEVPNTFGGDGLLAFQFISGGNPNLLIKPEKVTSQEYGAYTELFDKKVTLDVAYYTQLNNGVIMDVAVPYLSGAPNIDNAGLIKNWGWEFDVKFDPLQSADNKTSFIIETKLALNNNKVLKVAPQYNGSFAAQTPNGFVFARTGQNAFTYAFTDWIRTPDGKVIVDPTTGRPTVNDVNPVFSGRTLPNYFGSINLSFTKGRFTVASLIEFSGGNKQSIGKAQVGLADGTNPQTNYNDRKPFVFPNSVYDDGTGKYVDNTSVLVDNANRSLYLDYQRITSNYILSANFWKLREVAVRYNLPYKGKVINDISVNIYARDLFSIYPGENKFGDPQLLRSPGQRVFAPVPSTIVSSSSESSALPGIVTMGISIQASF
jgi:TonB-linked SusC/RagA family outer membrane protein